MKEFKRILVTGGSGLVGAALKEELPQALYPTRQEMDLLNYQSIVRYLYINKIDAVIHAAAKVGGIHSNTAYVSDFYRENSIINNNLLEACKKQNVVKLVSLLSTCIYPESEYVKYPMTEDQLHLGPPHSSNFGYAYAKRMLDVQSKAYRQQYGCNFVSIVPNNLYGVNDYYHYDDSHVIPALTRKIYEAKIMNKPTVVIWGDGSPLREFTYSKDVAKITKLVLFHYDEPDIINIGNTEEISIKDVALKLCKIIDYRGDLVFDTTKPLGPLRKPSSNEKFLSMGLWDKNSYTSLEQGLTETCQWFRVAYPMIRGF